MRRNVWGRGRAERSRESPNAAVGTALRHSGNTQHSRIRVASLSTFVAHGPSIRGRKCSNCGTISGAHGAVDNRERRDLLDLEQQEEEEDVQQDEQQRDERQEEQRGEQQVEQQSRAGCERREQQVEQQGVSDEGADDEDEEVEEQVPEARRERIDAAQREQADGAILPHCGPPVASTPCRALSGVGTVGAVRTVGPSLTVHAHGHCREI